MCLEELELRVSEEVGASVGAEHVETEGIIVFVGSELEVTAISTYAFVVGLRARHVVSNGGEGLFFPNYGAIGLLLTPIDSNLGGDIVVVLLTLLVVNLESLLTKRVVEGDLDVWILGTISLIARVEVVSRCCQSNLR